ncbi:MAG TPA: hypothetical protein VGH32_09975 [Pirellulales bacterium]
MVQRFGAGSYETQLIEGRWFHRDMQYRDNLTRLVVDVPDTVANRNWIRAFKTRWKRRLEQLELWVVSYRIEIE